MAGATVVAAVIVAAMVIPERRTAADDLLSDLERASGQSAAPAPAPTEPAPTGPPASTTADAGDDDDDTKDADDTANTDPDTDDATATEPTKPSPSSGPTTSGPAVSAAPTSTTTTTTTAATAAGPTVVGMFGDSIALSLALSLNHTADARAFVLRNGVADIGCGIALSPSPPADRPEHCDDALTRTDDAVRTSGIEVAVVASCQWELVAQQIPGDPTARAPGDPVFDEYVRAGYVREIETLRTAGAERVLWVRCPRLSTDVGTEGLDQLLLESRDPTRVDRVNEIVEAIAANRDDVDVLDLASWVDGRPADATLRPDGSHYEFERDTGVARELTRLIEAEL